ncbi:Myc-type [Hirschfeldia incana]|nr:Myc-type [Hirschfeldia incana]
MDNFFLDSLWQEEDIFLDLIAGDVSSSANNTVSVPNRSAFKSYVRNTEQTMVSCSSSVNVNKRVLNHLRKIWEEKKNVLAPEKERCRRHMIQERKRRVNQKQSYLALHSLLPFATKNDKISIVEKAVDQIRKLEEYKQELERRMNALEAKSTEIRFSLQEPLSGMDSMVESLQCLKSMGTKLNTVQANFSPHEFSATMNIETQIQGEEVEGRVERRLQETEWRFLFRPQAPLIKDK